MFKLHFKPGFGDIVHFFNFFFYKPQIKIKPNERKNNRPKRSDRTEKIKKIVRYR
jgi:hypothetical protein